jgi:hypothetical protein
VYFFEKVTDAPDYDTVWPKKMKNEERKMMKEGKTAQVSYLFFTFLFSFFSFIPNPHF